MPSAPQDRVPGRERGVASSLSSFSPSVQSRELTPLPRVHPHRLTCGARVLTVFPSPPAFCANSGVVFRRVTREPDQIEIGAGHSVYPLGYMGRLAACVRAW